MARAKGEGHLVGSNRLVTTVFYRARVLSTPLPNGVSIWYCSDDGSWWMTALGGSVKLNAPPTSLGVMSYDPLIAQGRF